LTDDNWNLRPPGVKVGERVLFGKWAGTEVIIGGEDRLFLKESEIPGVIEGRARVSANAT
jgi:chaperonin GroES